MLCFIHQKTTRLADSINYLLILQESVPDTTTDYQTRTQHGTHGLESGREANEANKAEGG